MKKRNWILVSTMLVLLVTAGFRPTIKPDELYDPCAINNWTFTGGEEITYKIYYNWNFMWLAAGEAVFRVYDEGDTYHLSVKGTTYKSYEWFFKVRDSYDTWVDKTTLLPKVAIRDVSEGNYKLYEKMIFDQENSKITSYRGNTPKDAVKKEFRINDCMHDLISIIYHARNLEYEKFAKGQEYPIKIFMDKEVWPLSVKYKGRYKQVTVKGGTKFKAFKFSPDVISGEVFKEGTQMDIWVSDDNNRIPVYIESPVSVGSVKIVLKDYKGLKYPLTAKI